MKLHGFHPYPPVGGYDVVDPIESILVRYLSLPYDEVIVQSAGYNFAGLNVILHGPARGGDDIHVTGRQAHTFRVHEVEVAVDMVRTVWLHRKVVDRVQSTRELDYFTCALRRIEKELDRGILDCSAFSVGGGGLFGRRRRRR